MNTFTRRDACALVCLFVPILFIALSWRGGNRRVQQATCVNNLRVLVSGFDSYLEETDHLPYGGRLRQEHVEDWVHWQKERELSSSAIAGFTMNFSPELLRCPGDRKFRKREYIFSYSMNAYLEKRTASSFTNLNRPILLFEEVAPNDGACAIGSRSDELTQRHNGRSNTGFMDGSVETLAEHAAATVRNFPAEGAP